MRDPGVLVVELSEGELSALRRDVGQLVARLGRAERTSLQARRSAAQQLKAIQMVAGCSAQLEAEAAREEEAWADAEQQLFSGRLGLRQALVGAVEQLRAERRAQAVARAGLRAELRALAGRAAVEGVAARHAAEVAQKRVEQLAGEVAAAGTCATSLRAELAKVTQERDNARQQYDGAVHSLLPPAHACSPSNPEELLKCGAGPVVLCQDCDAEPQAGRPAARAAVQHAADCAAARRGGGRGQPGAAAEGGGKGKAGCNRAARGPCQRRRDGGACAGYTTGGGRSL